MKLLKLEIGKLPKEKQFRSLNSGFKIEFHKLYIDNDSKKLDLKSIESMESFCPFCFAGLNGSGKSNVLEALANIFFHMECCVAKFQPESFQWHFRPYQSVPDSFRLEYLIGQYNSSSASLASFDKIIIEKEMGKDPLMFKQNYPFSSQEEITPVSLISRTDLREPQAAEGKLYLPDIIVGYSSGENEILSLPFRKSRLINFDKYIEDYTKSYAFEEPENSMIYIDAEMSQAVLLACLLFENDKTLEQLRNEIGIVGIKSFRINLNNHETLIKRKNKEGFREDDGEFEKILNHDENLIDFFKRSSTCWHEYSQKNINPQVLTFDFMVDNNTKQMFKDEFRTSFEFFRSMQVLYELNAHIVNDNQKEDVYKSQGFYTDGKLPVGGPEENVFYFLDYLVLKRINGENYIKPFLLRELSDGEHQFLHTMGICLMLKHRRSLLLLDEPETHFNPDWRAKFIKILNDSIEAGGGNNLLKEILLTSHSPFIISDCFPNNVILFNKGLDGKSLTAFNALEIGLKTYGSDVNYILKNFFNTNLISNKSSTEMREIIERGDIDELRSSIDRFGESSEKQFLFQKIYEKMNFNDDNSDNKL